MTDRPIFSVIIPTHKRARLLKRALQSIKTQNTSALFEVIVVADCVDAQTSALCDEILGPNDIYLRRNGAPGPSLSRNLGLGLAKGRFTLFLDDDDAWHQGLLAQLMQSANLMSGRPIYFNCSVVKERRLPEEIVFLNEAPMNLAGMLSQQVYVKNQVHMSCFAFPTDLVKDLTFDASLRAYEDWDFLLSLFDHVMPVHEAFLGSRVFEVDDETTDRRGSTQAATDFNAVLDYLHIYRRHPAPTPELKQARSQLMTSVGVAVPAEML
jgi:glycosyltransferase involved in cell wall biosynthesis